jgi:Aspartyl/Asparaginyl beta-hydroxylase
MARCFRDYRLKNFMKLSGGIDTTPLLLAIKRNPDLWKPDDYLRNVKQGDGVESIILRFPEFESDLNENVDYPPYHFLTEARPMVMNLMSYVGGERLGRVVINKIKAGGSIVPHCDEHGDYWDRFHIVLQSSRGVVFRCEDETVNMATGEVWWFQNSNEHEVINNSGEDRIHLIVDIRTRKC